MGLTTRQRLNRQNFPLTLLRDVINIVHRLARRNPRVLDIRDRYRRLLLEAEKRYNDDPDDSTYAPSDGEDSGNGY